MTAQPDTFDVIATNIKTGVRRLMATGETKLSAEDFIKMAVFRRGVNEEYYSAVPNGSVKMPDDQGAKP